MMRWPPTLSPSVTGAVLGHVAGAEGQHVLLILVGADDFFVDQHRLVLEAGRHADPAKGARHQA